MSNIKQYCKRMGESVIHTTKGHIPDIININGDIRKILDVGCADGSFTRYLSRKLENKKTNITAIDAQYCLYTKNNEFEETVGNIHFDSKEFNEKFVDQILNQGSLFDCIVFSSVMHEISSYSSDKKEQYTKTPIKKAIKLASKILNPGGIIIVRDMIKPPHHRTKTVSVEFRDNDKMNGFLRFIQHCPYYSKTDKSSVSKFMAYSSDPNRIIFNIREDVLMEFLMCFTWGWGSFPREVREKKFIMDKQSWLDAFESAGLQTTLKVTTKEEYPKYFDKIIKVWDPRWIYPDTTCLFVAKKN